MITVRRTHLTDVARDCGQLFPQVVPMSINRGNGGFDGLGDRRVDLGQLPRDGVTLQRQIASAFFQARVGQGAVAAIDAGEDRLEAVIIGLRDRVELVIVAAGAVDGQAQK